jgi:S1-C subfamily serine protease
LGIDSVALDSPIVQTVTETVIVEPDIDAMDIVAAREEVLSRIYEESLPSVVYVRVVHRLDPDDEQFGRDFFGQFPRGPFDEYQHGAGSGFVWDEEGHILTNWHVVEGSDSVSVVFHDGEEYDAEFLGGDPDSDLAILKIDVDLRDLKPLPRGDLADIRVGQMALAIGSPFGQDFTLTSGIVSALGRTIRSGSGPYSIPLVVQTDAPINPGNSGGPLLDRHGRVIGINTQIISNSGSNSGVGFAVPIDIAKQVAPDLIEHGKYEYAWLGISGTTLTQDAAEYLELPEGSRGVLVVRVIDDGPASEAGLRGGDEEVTLEDGEVTLGGDVILAVNGEVVKDMHDLISYLVEHTRPDDEIEINILRSNGDKETISVTLGTRPEN